MMESITSPARSGAGRLRAATLSLVLAGACGAPHEDSADDSAHDLTAERFPVRIEAGGGSSFVDGAGETWRSDFGFLGGRTVERGAIAISGTADDAIYRTERWGLEGYRFSVPNGQYRVQLHFAETFEGVTAPGTRVFDVAVGDSSLPGVDVFARAGGRQRAFVLRAPEVEVRDRELTIRFTPRSGQPMVNGLVIESLGTAIDPGGGSGCRTPRSWFENPYGHLSAFHRPVGTEARYADDDHPATKAWLANAHARLNLNAGYPFGASFARVGEPEPFVSVDGEGCYIKRPNGLPVRLRIPRGVFPPESPPPGCFDGNTSILDSTEGVVHELYEYRHNGGRPTASIHRTYPVTGLGHGSRLGEVVGVTAVGAATVGGALHAWELEREGQPIEHALAMILPRKPGHPEPHLISKRIQWPATLGDGSASLPENNTGPIAYGALLAIPPASKGGPSLDALGLSEAGRRLAQAMRDYGVYVVDGGDAIALRVTGSLSGSLRRQLLEDTVILKRHLRLGFRRFSG